MARRLPRQLREQLLEPIHLTGVTYQHKFVWCVKMKKWYGPYWYAFWRSPAEVSRSVRRGDNRKVVARVTVRTPRVTKGKYIGKELPASIVEAFRADSETPEHIEREVRRQMRKR